MTAVKVLFAGAAEGAVSGLLTKVATVNKKVGADCLFCVGEFFGQGDPSADPDDSLVGYATGDTQVPLPTYFIGGYGKGCQPILEALPASDCKLKHLGRAGVVELHGLTVAFLDGTYNAAAFHADAPAPNYSPYFTRSEVEALKEALSTLTGEVDVLLTCEWPKGVTSGVHESQAPQGMGHPDALGSAVVAEIAMLARPRYHFAGGQDCHFARAPYTNKDLGAGARATRFISLAPTASPSKAKSLHALNLVPAAAMDPDALSAIPDGSTPCPYDTAARGVKRPFADQELPEGQDWRWSMKKGRRPPGGGGGKEGGEGGGPREPPVVIPGRTDIPKDPFATVTARNVPFRATEADIVHFFSQAGKVVNVVRTANPEGRLNSWLTVQFEGREGADKALQLHGSDFMGRQVTVEPVTHSGRKPAFTAGVPVDGCWFCLGSASVDLSLVASVGDEAYLALDKGAITDHHVLVVPVDHFPSSASLSPPAHTEVQRYLSALRTCYSAHGLQLVAFERHLTLRSKGGNHCHINAIGVKPEAAAKAKEVFQAHAQRAGFTLTELTPPAAPAQPEAEGAGEGAAPPIPPPSASEHAALRSAVGDGEYFLAMLPDGTSLVRPIMRGERWPMNLGREVLAELAGCPERADWKACSVPPAEEEARTTRFKEMFGAYDIMQ